MTARACLCLLSGLALAICFAGAVPARAEAPARVVSMNLCADQLAMLLAAPGQLYSVSHVALDAHVSAMAGEAAQYSVNHGRAEEIFQMRPDLVIAGAYSDRATVDMLRRLGIRVEVFAPAVSLADVRDRIGQMGDVLHRPDAARAMLADFDARLAALSAEVSRRPRAVLYYANGFTSGDATLAGQILLAAGFANAAEETGHAAGRRLPLEVLAMTNAEAVITARPYPGASRSEAVLDHPVVRALRRGRSVAAITDHDWVCGTPFVLRAIENLAVERQKITGVSQ